MLLHEVTFVKPYAKSVFPKQSRDVIQMSDLLCLGLRLYHKFICLTLSIVNIAQNVVYLPLKRCARIFQSEKDDFKLKSNVFAHGSRLLFALLIHFSL